MKGCKECVRLRSAVLCCEGEVTTAVRSASSAASLGRSTARLVERIAERRGFLTQRREALKAHEAVCETAVAS